MHPILILVPAFNEEANIAQVIDMLVNHNRGWDILVINDASEDRTSDLAWMNRKARVIDLPFNLGVGGAMQTGFKYALRHHYSIVMQFDGDGQHQAEEIDKLIEPIINQEADVTIGSRFLEKHTGYRSTWSRRFGIRIFEWLTLFLIRQRITDCTSGFRAYNRKVIEFLASHYPGDYPEPEAVILLGKNRFRMKEISTAMQQRQGGSSSITIFNSPYYMTKVSLGMIMTALRPRIINRE